MIQDIQNYFNENKYVVIRNFLSPELANVLYQYCKIKVQREDHKYTYDRGVYNNHWDGFWGDGQIATNTYAMYGDPMFDGLLNLSTPAMQQYTGLSLLPQYSYWRFYQKDDELVKHVDRDSCEISTTVCIGYDVSNIDSQVYPDYDWPMFVKNLSGEEIPVHMKPGDMIIYKGCEVEHWREKFTGLNHAQIFMHYNDANGPFNQIYDGRSHLGIPKKSFRV